MKPLVRKLLGLAAVAVMAAFFVTVLTATRAERSRLSCHTLSVEIADSSRMSFVSEEDVRNYLLEYGPCVGRRLDSIDLARIERTLEHKSAVLGSEAWITDDGTLHVRVSQRKPVIRFQKGAGGFYADDQGFLFPLSRYGTKVPVVDGAIPLQVGDGFKGEPATEEEKAWLRDMIDLASYIGRNRIWSENIAQITVQPSGDLVLVPASGRERFLFGPPKQAEEKFARIRDYYEYIAPSKEEGYYRTVNVKFKGQIVCRQK